MLPRDDGYFVSWLSNLVSAVQRVLKHGTCSNECAVLFRLLITQPLSDKRFESFTLTSRKDDRPSVFFKGACTVHAESPSCSQWFRFRFGGGILGLRRGENCSKLITAIDISLPPGMRSTEIGAKVDCEPY